MARMRPLQGITVVDCTRVLAGPLCTMLLGDLGADVIKIEQPGRGDETRGWGPPFVGGESPYFWTVNRNKRSLTLDLGHAAGRAIFERLLNRSQVLVENFKVGTLQRWGYDSATLSRINPALVHTAITAYGPDGPRAQQPGYDALLQAESGWMSVTGEPDGAPMKVGMALIDVLTGLHAASATQAALRVAEHTGQVSPG
jgi:crotonobetainyl-CoA:carnitine CoA-transferase CaiB-like acyl-CoA transferase